MTPSPDPVLHVLSGPNGSGKSTYASRVLQPVTHLPFVNADVIAAREWPGAESEHAYEASGLAAAARERLLAGRVSFITETVFSHPSKVSLIRLADSLGYHVTLHVMLVPVDTTVSRVAHRVRQGGHTVPEQKIRERYDRLWPLVAEARDLAERAYLYDNSCARTPFRLLATYHHGRLLGSAQWPVWTPDAVTGAG